MVKSNIMRAKFVYVLVFVPVAISSVCAEVVDSGGDVDWHTSIAFDSNRNPHISYYDDSNSYLKHAYTH